MLKTFFLESPDATAVRNAVSGPRLRQQGVTGFVRSEYKAFRAVALSDRLTCSSDLIVRTLDGDRWVDAALWVQRSVLDDLHDKYLARAPVKPRLLEAAKREWQDAVARVAEAEVELVEAREAFKRSAKELVMAHGRTSVEIAGRLYDFSYTGKDVYLVERRHPKPEILDENLRRN